MLANINFYVTEDKDVKRLYQYLSIIKNRPYADRISEIQNIKELYRELNDDTNFPVEKVLNFLLSENDKNLTVPVSILQLQNTLPQVLDKFETIIWIYRSIDEITFLTVIVEKLPSDWDNSVIKKAKKRIGQIAKATGFQPSDQITESAFKTKLIEAENNWFLEEADEDLGFELESKFNILHNIIYEEELASSHDYMSLEEYFESEEGEKTYTIKCDECGHEFELILDYRGVTEVDQREMGAEMFHEWSGEDECSECDSEVSLTYELYEYPEWAENDDALHCDGCEVLPEKSLKNLHRQRYKISFRHQTNL